MADVVRELGLKIISSENMLSKKEVDGVYICDMLSWVMSHGSKGNIWITVQSNINIVAIASLVEISCILIPESIQVDDFTIKKADEQGIVILASEDSSYKICKSLVRLLEDK